MFTFLPALVLLAVVWRAMKPAERLRLLQATAAIVRRLRAYGSGELEAFEQTLRARAGIAVVTAALIAVNVFVFVGLLFGHGAMSDPATRVAWGASVGTRTTNGEWSRLVTMAFVHKSAIALIINMTALFQIGTVLERQVGRLAFALNYLLAILFAALASVSAYPTAVCAGASGAVFGTYGLLTASIAGGIRRRSPFSLPFVAMVRFAPMAALFVLYNLAASGLGWRGDIVGFIAGLVFGAVVARDVRESTPAPRQLAKAFGMALLVVVVSAIGLRGITDIAPEIRRLVELEHRTAGVYDAALEKFRKGRTPPAGLVAVIDRSVVPEFQAAEVQLHDLRGVPAQDQPRLGDAQAYVQLRLESWQLRAHGLRESSTPLVPAAGAAETVSLRRRAEARLRSNAEIMANAETAAHAALDALKRIAPEP